MSVILLLLFPVSAGPYSATHGPVTELSDIGTAKLLVAMIALGGIIQPPLAASVCSVERPFAVSSFDSEASPSSSAFVPSIRC